MAGGSISLKFVISSIGLVGFCLGADYVLFKCADKWSNLPRGVLLRAVSDSVVHGLVGGWCWINTALMIAQQEGYLLPTPRILILQVATCIVIAAGLDLDHMIEARSFSIKDALNLSKRPFAHNTTLVLFVAAILYSLVNLYPPLKQNVFTKDLPLMFLIATISHHLRDADRRGVWLSPLPSGAPIPYKLYLLLIALLPVGVVIPRWVVLKGLIAVRNAWRAPSNVIFEV